MAPADRECQHYYQPWLAAHRPAATDTKSRAELAARQQDLEPLSSPDDSLAAFAHIVVLRLNVQRCFICLLDTAHQYVLSEATRTLFSGHPDWIGGAAVAGPDALCEHCLVSRCHASDVDDFVTEGIVVNDVQADDRFSTQPNALDEERAQLRFYAGVPLVSRNGHKIGVLAVEDENPRNGLRADELGCMRDLARCAMSHLESVRDRADCLKGERVVRGIATFIEQASTLHDNPTYPSNQRQPSLQDHRPWRRTQRRNSHSDADGVLSLAADILRDCTLADGCVIFGAKADVSARDHDGSPLDRSCKMLSLSVVDEHVDNPLWTGQEPGITLRKLYEYFKIAPQGQVFTFPEDAQATTSEGELLDSCGKDNDAVQMVHEELLQKLSGACHVVFLPLKQPAEGRLIAGIFLWTLTFGRMADTDLAHVRTFANCIVGEIMRIDLQHDEAAKTTFMASMSHELRSPLHGILGSAEFLFETTKDAYEAGLVSSIITCGKTLLDTLNHVLDHSKINKSTDLQNQANTRPASASSIDGAGDLVLVDLGALIEELADAVTAAHTFKTISTFSSSTAEDPVDKSEHSFDSLSAQRDDEQPESSLGVAVLLDITPRESWMVRVPQGSLQRIVMNLFGNALKYTTSGFVALSLRTLESTEAGFLSVLIRVVDSGKGIGHAFQRDNLFVPFSQENPFHPGTGLGLSIVKQIVDSLGGSVEVKSTTGAGTEVDVILKLAAKSSPALSDVDLKLLDQPYEMHKHPLAMAAKMAGKKLVLLDPLDPDKTRAPTHQASRFQQTIRETCERWFGMHVSRATSMSNDDDVDIYFYGEPPPMELLRSHRREYRQRAVPVILACQNGHDAIDVIRNQQKFLREVGEIVEVVQEPCGPRKLAKTLMYCLNRAEEINDQDAGAFEALTSPPPETTEELLHSMAADGPRIAHRPASVSRKDTRTTGQELRKSVSAALALPTTPALDPETPSLRSRGDGDTSLDLLAPEDMSSRRHEQDSNVAQQSPPSSKKPHVLIVDDNKINRQLLATFMKKNAFTYEQAENGQEAVDIFASSHSTGVHFDYVLMDISMPIMDGMEATRKIRTFEVEQRQGGSKQSAKIFALTGLAGEQVREEAEAAGVDLFLPKPVKFARLSELLV